jgi:putative acetyltransferase
LLSQARLKLKTIAELRTIILLIICKTCDNNDPNLMSSLMEQLKLNLRQATEADAPRLHELHTISVRTICSKHYAPEVIDGWLLNRRPHGYLPPIQRGDIFVAEYFSNIVGFGEAVPGMIIAVYVDPTAVERHVGSAIMLHALNIARTGYVGPIHLEATLNAVGFYERFGFREVKRVSVQRGPIAVPCILMELLENRPSN